MQHISCQNCKKEFSLDESDVNFYQMVDVPHPTFCPECRFIRRLTFRNDRSLYKRTCEICKKDVLSIYRPNGGFKVVCQKCWWSDDFDATVYARDYDFSKPFFEQYKELMRDVPMLANFVVDESRMINSPYNNMVLDLRNCYMMFDSDFNEDCSYGCEVEKSRTCVDTNLIDSSEMCYESVNLQNCYRAFYSVDCESSSDIWFSRDCNGCTDCFGCINLRKQSYCIFNEPYGTKEAYQARLRELGLDSRTNIEEIKKQVAQFWSENGIQKYMHEKQTEDSSGDYVYNCRNTHESFIAHECWNVKHSQYLVAPNTKDSYDVTQFGNGIELFCDVLQGGNGGQRVRFSWFVPNENQNIDYCVQVMTSHDMFGCLGLRKKEFCILNKQYSEEEYKKLRAEIIEQMNTVPYTDSRDVMYKYGEFFPSELSPFAYNETTAQEFFPLTKTEVQAKGLQWFTREARNYVPTIKVGEVPDTLADVTETITSEIIECANKGSYETCTTAFRVIPDEASFYQRFNLPLPAKCPNCRHRERMAHRNLPIFRKGNCADETCGQEFLTGYGEELDGKLYCKEHFLQRVS